MKILSVKIAIALLLYSQVAVTEYRAEFVTQLVNSNKTLYVSRTLPVGGFIDSIDLGTHSPWVWWNVKGSTEVGIYLPGIFGDPKYIPGVGYVREINGSGIGYAIHGTVMSPCSGSAYVDGKNTKDGNISNRLICRSNAPSSNYIVKLRADFYKVGSHVNSQTLPTTYAAMLILFHHGFVTTDLYGRLEPKVNIGPINVVSSGCEIKNKVINVALGNVGKSSFSGVGSISPESKKKFRIQLDCGSISPIKITFIGAQDPSQTLGAIALNNLTGKNTAKGYAIQVKYKGAPIKLNQLIPIVEKRRRGKYNLIFEAAYIQTQTETKAGKANGTLQFNLQYH